MTRPSSNNNIELNSMGYPKHFIVDKHGWYDLNAMKQNCSSEAHKLAKGICSPFQMLSSVTRRHPKSTGVVQQQLNEQVHELIELKIVQNSFDGSGADMENTQLSSLIEINNKINKLQYTISGYLEILQLACENNIEVANKEIGSEIDNHSSDSYSDSGNDADTDNNNDIVDNNGDYSGDSNMDCDSDNHDSASDNNVGVGDDNLGGQDQCNHSEHEYVGNDFGGDSDGEYSDGKYSDGKYSDGKYSDGGYSDGKHSDGNITDRGYSDGGYSDGGGDY